MGPVPTTFITHAAIFHYPTTFVFHFRFFTKTNGENYSIDAMAKERLESHVVLLMQKIETLSNTFLSYQTSFAPYQIEHRG